MNTPVGACANCGAPLTGPYCAQCGQKLPNNELTLREFVQETTAELTHLEGRVPSTLRALFAHPGQLTKDFLAGRRTRWVAPLKLYLICSLVYFVTGPLIESITHRSARELEKQTVANPDGTRTMSPEMRRDIEESFVGKLLGPERFERAIPKIEQINRTIATGYPKAMFLLLPVFAWLTYVAWRKKLPRYPMHLYLALHLHAAWFVVLTLLDIVGTFTPLSLIAIPFALTLAYLVGYSLLAFRRVFGDSWLATIGRTAFVATAYSAALFTLSLTMLAIALFTV